MHPVREKSPKTSDIYIGASLLTHLKYYYKYHSKIDFIIYIMRSSPMEP